MTNEFELLSTRVDLSKCEMQTFANWMVRAQTSAGNQVSMKTHKYKYNHQCKHKHTNTNSHSNKYCSRCITSSAVLASCRCRFEREEFWQRWINTLLHKEPIQIVVDKYTCRQVHLIHNQVQNCHHNNVQVWLGRGPSTSVEQWSVRVSDGRWHLVSLVIGHRLSSALSS